MAIFSTSNKDPDDMLVVLFKHVAIKNAARSKEEGREVFDDVEVCEIRAPGAKDVKVFPATGFSRWLDDPFTGEQIKQSYAERFSYQYRQFKAKAAQTKSGTPLDLLPFLSEGRRAELKAQNIYTLEQLAGVEGNELKNLGPGGRDMKNQAIAFIEESRNNAPNLRMAAELEALRARNNVLEEDAKILAERVREKALAEAKEPDGMAAELETLRARNAVLETDTQQMTAQVMADKAADEFADMTVAQLREYIRVHTGQAPLGSLTRKTLLRMASEARGPLAGKAA